MPATAPMLSSTEWIVGSLALLQLTELCEVQPTVVHALVSRRPLEELSCCPKFTPITLTLPVCVRALLSTPR